MKVSSDKQWLFKAERAVMRTYLMALQNKHSSFNCDLNPTHDGKLGLDIESREEIKCEFIKPHLGGYDDFCKANEIDDEKVIIPFEGKAEEMMRIVEQRVINMIIEVIDEEFNLH